MIRDAQRLLATGGPLRTVVVRQLSRNTCRLHCCRIVKELVAPPRHHKLVRSRQLCVTRGTPRFADRRSLRLGVAAGGEIMRWKGSLVKLRGCLFSGSFQNYSRSPFFAALERSGGVYWRFLPISPHCRTWPPDFGAVAPRRWVSPVPISCFRASSISGTGTIRVSGAPT